MYRWLSWRIRWGRLKFEERVALILTDFDRRSFRSGKGSLNGNARCKVAPFTGPDDGALLRSGFGFSEPAEMGMMPEQDAISLAAVERKAKSFGIPLSLRMIKKKLKLEQDLTNWKDTAYCPVNSAFASMVFIVVELQKQALIMREASCQEDLQPIKSKVQKEMYSSFVWMFQQVFSTTPSLMLQVMILVANFGLNSAASIGSAVEPAPASTLSGDGVSIPQIGTIAPNPSIHPAEDLKTPEEAKMWNSIVDQAMKMQGESNADALAMEAFKYFVSPVTVRLEPDPYDDYLRTDLTYQMNLATDPDNPLLLCNYAQFLHLVARDYDRAEECYKKAIQTPPSDADPLVQYANFLWTIRRDFSGAEERYLQALAISPGSVHYASRYANFLWGSGGEETCYPLCQH